METDTGTATPICDICGRPHRCLLPSAHAGRLDLVCPICHILFEISELVPILADGSREEAFVQDTLDLVYESLRGMLSSSEDDSESDTHDYGPARAAG